MRYYSGFLFFPTIVAGFCKFFRRTITADVAHCQGVEPQSYGTTFDFFAYDSNHNLVSMPLYHSIGSECDETWKIVFRLSKRYQAFKGRDASQLLTKIIYL